MSSPPKITLTMRLAPPLPPRKFLFVCHQKTIKELKNEIRRRLVSIIKEPVAITVNGYELMDDDDVVDVLAKDVNIVLHLAASLDRDIAESLHDVEEYDGPPPASPSPPSLPPAPSPPHGLLMIRKREHGSKKGAGSLAKSAKTGRVYPAELAFEQASPAADSGSSSDSDSDSGTSSDSDSDTSSDTSMHSNVTKSSSDSAEVSSSDESDRRSVLESLPVSS